MKNGLIAIGLLAIAVIGMIDLHLTLDAHRAGLLDEANPVMRAALKYGGEKGLITVKATLTLVGCAVLGLIARYAGARFRVSLFLVLLAATVTAYGGLMFWWAVWLHHNG